MRSLNIISSIFLLIAALPTVQAASLQNSQDVVSATNLQGTESQQRIEQAGKQADAMLQEYRQLINNTQYQEGYNEELQLLKQEQDEEIASLKKQLDDIRVTQQRIVPLMRNMADTLEQFIALDLPFQQEERLSRILKMKQHLRSPTVSIPEKFRVLLENYQIETDYGRTIAAWRGQTGDSRDNQKSVQFLRIGRIALYYQTLDGNECALWNSQTKQWELLPTEYHDAITTGLRLAENQVAPQMLVMPLPAATTGAATIEQAPVDAEDTEAVTTGDAS